MRKLFSSVALALICHFAVNAQPAAKEKLIDELVVAISRFNARESKRDSLLNHPLGSNSEADFHRRFLFYDSLHTAIKKMERGNLSFDELVNLELIIYEVEDELSTWTYKSYLNPILSDEGFHTRIASMGFQVMTTKKEFENYIRRLEDIPRSVDERLVLMRKGLELGISQPAQILANYRATYEQHIVTEIGNSVFWKPFVKKPFQVSDEDWRQLTERGRTAIRQSAVESFKKIRSFFESEYLPKARRTIGVSHFPDGLAYYQERVKHYTTTDLSYEEVYQLGLREVDRIKKRMLAVIEEIGYRGSFRDFIATLRSDPRYYATSAEQLLKEASFIAKKIDGLLPRYFGKLPRQPYGVEPVPEHLAPTYTAGRYSGAPLNSRRAGFYWVNTYDLKSRPLYALESLTLHEAVPGHHLQIALTKELDSLPSFRRNLYVNAFGEGWGLYAEYLGEEMGLYQDKHSYFGRLTYEMWRACRLVLDVALHTKGWTREQAVSYLAENTALSLHEVNTEINRYISWPGQALAYKMGELKIKELRRLAEDRLREKFDIREFHDLILSQGTVTLKIMEQMVERFINEKLKE